MIIVTGGAGFIGSNFIRHWLQNEEDSITTVDKLTYAGNLENLASLEFDPRHTFCQADIGNEPFMTELFKEKKPRAIVNFAAETHVDRSIHQPAPFLETNVVGTCRLLDATLNYWKELPSREQENFLFLHISTDEVYGSLEKEEISTTEKSPYRPNSPYAASKAASDHYVRAYHNTYGLPAIITYSSNNFGPCQFPEKFLPLLILNGIQGKPLPIYGDGLNIRNWLYVKDHCEALRLLIKGGRPGETYNIASQDELTNLDLVELVCDLLDKRPLQIQTFPTRNLITFIQDRPGHDKRYSLNSEKIRNELGWKPLRPLSKNLEKTVNWYIDNPKWIDNVLTGEYRNWIKLQYEGLE